MLAKFNRVAAKRIALSALKAFAAGAGAIVIARQTELLHGGIAVLKGVAVAALFAGLDAAAKALQVALES